MAVSVATVPRQKEVLVLSSSWPVLGVVSWRIVAKTVSGLTGRPTTSSTASPKQTEYHNIKVVRNLPRRVRPRQLLW